ncbi:Os08g0156750 [Oryza sativa Japonica Group]|nr:Os08g0156750 [Oryza sativa Japonica Group]
MGRWRGWESGGDGKWEEMEVEGKVGEHGGGHGGEAEASASQAWRRGDANVHSDVRVRRGVRRPLRRTATGGAPPMLPQRKRCPTNRRAMLRRGGARSGPLNCMASPSSATSRASAMTMRRWWSSASAPSPVMPHHVLDSLVEGAPASMRLAVRFTAPKR